MKPNMAFVFVSALALAPALGLAADYNPAHQITPREAVDLLNGLSSIADGYACGEDNVPQQNSPIPLKKTRYCPYNLEGGTIMRLARNIEKLNAIIRLATSTQTKLMGNFGTDGSRPMTIQQVAPDKQPLAQAAMQEVLDSPSPFIGEKFTEEEFKLGPNKETQNRISGSDIAKILRLMEPPTPPPAPSTPKPPAK